MLSWRASPSPAVLGHSEFSKERVHGTWRTRHADNNRTGHLCAEQWLMTDRSTKHAKRLPQVTPCIFKNKAFQVYWEGLGWGQGVFLIWELNPCCGNLERA